MSITVEEDSSADESNSNSEVESSQENTEREYIRKLRDRNTIKASTYDDFFMITIAEEDLQNYEEPIGDILFT